MAHDPQRSSKPHGSSPVLILKTSGVVIEVSTFALTLTGNQLNVEFVGKRRKQYTNHPATVISVKGQCKLTGE